MESKSSEHPITPKVDDKERGGISQIKNEIGKIEEDKTTQGNGVDFRSVYPNDSISIFQRLGPQFGVNVKVLQKEGEKYRFPGVSLRIKEETVYIGVVRRGESYVRITSPKRDLQDFWKAVKAERASRQKSGNPPKTPPKI